MKEVLRHLQHGYGHDAAELRGCSCCRKGLGHDGFAVVNERADVVPEYVPPR